MPPLEYLAPGVAREERLRTRSSGRATGTGGRRERLPEFLVVGPQRTATTWLYERLLPTWSSRRASRRHVPSTHFKKGLAGTSRTSVMASDQPVGEIARPIFISAGAREHIARTIPHCKIVCTLRDPVSSCIPSTASMRQYGFTRASSSALSRTSLHDGSSRYAHHVVSGRRLFPRTTSSLRGPAGRSQGYLGRVSLPRNSPMAAPARARRLAQGSDSARSITLRAWGRDRGLPAQRTALWIVTWRERPALRGSSSVEAHRSPMIPQRAASCAACCRRSHPARGDIDRASAPGKT